MRRGGKHHRTLSAEACAELRVEPDNHTVAIDCGGCDAICVSQSCCNIASKATAQRVLHSGNATFERSRGAATAPHAECKEQPYAPPSTGCSTKSVLNSTSPVDMVVRSKRLNSDAVVTTALPSMAATRAARLASVSARTSRPTREKSKPYTLSQKGRPAPSCRVGMGGADVRCAGWSKSQNGARRGAPVRSQRCAWWQRRAGWRHPA